MSNSLIVRCFFVNARLEGKNVTMSCDNTYKIEIGKYNINKNVLVINSDKIKIRDVYESRDGDYMRIGEYTLEVS